MQRKIIIFIFLVLVNFLYSYDSITKWDGLELTSDNIQFDGEKFYFSNIEIPLKDVSFLSLNLKKDFQKDNKSFFEISDKEIIERSNFLQKKYPDSSKLILVDIGIQKLNKDGSRYSRSRSSIKIMNEKELNEAQLSFYNKPGNYENRIIFARSISPQGEIKILTENDIFYTKPSQDLSFFSGRKDTYIIKALIPDVKVGSIIDYEWETIEYAPEDKNQFYTHWYFGGTSPFYESIVSFIVPEDKDFYWVLKNFGDNNYKPEVKIEDGYKIITFKRGECPPFIEEKNSLPLYELIPYVLGSSFKDQTYLSEWLSKFFKERMILDDNIKKKIDEVIEKANAKTEEEKISALYRFVQEYIHYRSIKTSISSGMAGHPATETFYNKYGDCIDKSIFFATILNYIGVKAYPVIVMTNDEPQPPYGEIGILSGNHAINEVHLSNGKIIYLDSTSTTYKYPYFRSDDHGILAWNPLLNTVREISLPDPSLNTQTYNIVIKIVNSDIFEIEKENKYSGDYEAAYREYFSSLKKEEIESLINLSMGRDFPGAKLKNYSYLSVSDFSKDFYIKYSFNAPNILKKTNIYKIFKLPISYNFNFIGLTERKLPLDLKTTYGEKHKVIIENNSDLRIKSLPESLNIENNYIKYTAKWYTEGEKIIFEDHYVLKVRKVDVKDYKEFRKSLIEIINYIKKPLIFF